ncbi:MAG: hypothetical protein ABSB88_13280 [Bryobacteraceae bacterium]|jgi:hypothetical protein
MPAADTAEHLSSARLEVKRACDLLEAPNPASLEASSSALERAISGLNDCRRGIRPGVTNADVRARVRQLRAELRHAGRLLESAADFYRGWERILGAMSGGYTAGGEPAPVARTGKLYCQG